MSRLSHKLCLGFEAWGSLSDPPTARGIVPLGVRVRHRMIAGHSIPIVKGPESGDAFTSLISVLGVRSGGVKKCLANSYILFCNAPQTTRKP